MLRSVLGTIFSAAFLAVAAVAVTADEMRVGNAALETAEGKSAGLATLTETPNGVLITASLKNLTVGEHAFHIHETGKCKPDFSAAGGHFAPDGKEHGLGNPNGYHAGDMPNIFAASDGIAMVHIFNTRISLGDDEESIFDEDGAALIVHANPDTYLKDALAGDRVACGVIIAE